MEHQAIFNLADPARVRTLAEGVDVTIPSDGVFRDRLWLVMPREMVDRVSIVLGALAPRGTPSLPGNVWWRVVSGVGSVFDYVNPAADVVMNLKSSADMIARTGYIVRLQGMPGTSFGILTAGDASLGADIVARIHVACGRGGSIPASVEVGSAIG